MSPTTDPETWQRTSPLAALFFIGKIFSKLAKNFTQAIAPLAAFFVAFPGDAQTKVLLAVTGFVVFTLATSLLRYWFFRFTITDDAILIRDGVSSTAAVVKKRTPAPPTVGYRLMAVTFQRTNRALTGSNRTKVFPLGLLAWSTSIVPTAS